MSIVRGEAAVIKISDNDILCARNCVINLTTETIGKSTIGSGDWKEFANISKSWTASLEGVSYLGTGYNIDDILTGALAMATVAFKYIVTDEASNSIQMAGNAYITNVSVTGSVNNISSFNVELLGTGALTKT